MAINFLKCRVKQINFADVSKSLAVILNFGIEVR